MTKKELKQIEAIAEKLERYKITLIKETYIKKEGNKTFSKKPNETITKNYTCAGLIPVRLTSISPDRTEKVIRTFKIDYK